jgi:DNA-binding response OmpR family regulator
VDTTLTRERIDSFEELGREIVVFGSGRRLDDEEAARAVLSEPQVVLLRWPTDEAALDTARERRRPRFLVVEDNAEPPARWDRLEEWIRLPADRRDVQARVAALRSRAAELPLRPTLDGYDRLLFRHRWVALTPSDYNLIEPLVEHFDEVVPYERVVGGANGSEGAAPVAGRVRLTRLRRRIAPLGLEIRTVRPHGLALTVCETEKV